MQRLVGLRQVKLRRAGDGGSGGGGGSVTVPLNVDLTVGQSQTWTLTDAATNTAPDIFGLRHVTTSTAAAGFGLTTWMELENAAGTMKRVLTDVTSYVTATNGAETAHRDINLIQAGTLRPVVTFDWIFAANLPSILFGGSGNGFFWSGTTLATWIGGNQQMQWTAGGINSAFPHVHVSGTPAAPGVSLNAASTTGWYHDSANGMMGLSYAGAGAILFNSVNVWMQGNSQIAFGSDVGATVKRNGSFLEVTTASTLQAIFGGTTDVSGLNLPRGGSTSAPALSFAGATAKIGFFAGGGLLTACWAGGNIWGGNSTGLRMFVTLDEAIGAVVASAATLPLASDGNYVHVSGTTAIDFISTTNRSAGCRIDLYFDGAVTLNHNTGAPPGGTLPLRLVGSVNAAMAAGSKITLRFDSSLSRWVEVSRSGA